MGLMLTAVSLRLTEGAREPTKCALKITKWVHEPKVVSLGAQYTPWDSVQVVAISLMCDRVAKFRKFCCKAILTDQIYTSSKSLNYIHNMTEYSLSNHAPSDKTIL